MSGIAYLHLRTLNISEARPLEARILAPLPQVAHPLDMSLKGVLGQPLHGIPLIH
jgi:hypothetical protein